MIIIIIRINNNNNNPRYYKKHSVSQFTWFSFPRRNLFVRIYAWVCDLKLFEIHTETLPQEIIMEETFSAAYSC